MTERSDQAQALDVSIFDEDQRTPDSIAEGPDASNVERFRANFEAASRYGTLLGATRDAIHSEGESGRKAFDAYYDSLPGWQSWDEGVTALGGQLAGTMTGLENYIPLGIGARVLGAVGHSGTGLFARIFAGATDAAVTNAVIDSGIQTIEIASDRRDEFSVTQLAISTGLGAAAGGAIGGAAEVLGRQRSAAPAAPDAAPGAAADGLPAAPPMPADPASSAPPAAMAPEALAGDVQANPATDALPAAVDGVGEAAPIIEPVADPVSAAPVAVDPAGAELPISPVDAGAGDPASVETPAAAIDDMPAPEPALGEQLQSVAVARAQGDSLEQAIASISGPDETISSGPARNRGPQRPRRLVEFLAENGGIREEAGELAAVHAGSVFVPRVGPLVRGSGMLLDDARAAAAEAGYFSPAFGTPEQAVARTSVRDFLDLIDEDVRFKSTYREADAPALDTWHRHAGSKERRGEIKDLIQELDADPEISALGHDQATKTRVAEIMLDERMSFDDALERASMEEYYAGTTTPLRRGDVDLEEIPFGSGALDPAAAGDAGGGRPDRDRGGDRTGSAAESLAAEDGGEFQGDRRDAGEDGTRASLAHARQAGVISGRRSAVAATADPPTFTRLREITDRLRDVIDVPAVRQGRMSVRNAAGTYNFDNGALRMRHQDDFETFSHEVGHAVHARFGGMKGIGVADLQPLMNRHAGELKPMAYVGAKPAHQLEEGFAEWFRLNLTSPADAAKQAPKFTADFNAFLDKQAPEIRPVLEEIRTSYRDWMMQPSGRAVQSTIVSSRRPGWWKRRGDSVRRYGLGATIADELGRAYTSFLDNLHPLQRTVRSLAKIASDRQGKPIDLKAVDDPYKLARLSRNAHGAGHMDIMHGIVPYRGTNPGTASLRDAIVEAMSAPNALGRWSDDKAREFGAYLWSRRALGEWDRHLAGDIPNPPDKLSRGDHNLHVAEAEKANPQFVTAAAKVHEWALALWEKKLAAGLITPEQHAAGLAIKDYVPGLRAFDYDGDAVGAGGRGGSDARSSVVKRFKGSTRDVINPLESLMTDAYETASAIAHNDVIKSLDRLAKRAGHGGAAIAERIPAKEMRMMLADPLEVIEAAGRQAGMASPDVIAIRDMVESLLGDEKARIFRPAVINTKGETIVFFRDGGELRALRLADRDFGLEIYRALTTMSPAEKNLWLNLASVSSTTLRAGITSDPAFILANLIRDQAMASVFYGAPFKRLAGTFRGMADEVLGREAARLYNGAGGIMGGQEVAALRDGAVDRDLSALRNKGWLAQRFKHSNPVKWVKGVAEVAEISETGMRLGLYKTFYQEAQARGLADWEAMMEAAWRARDHMDFGRRGSQMAAMSRLVPFLNASLQGFDKVTREMIAPFFGDAVTAGEAGARAQAVKAWARLSALTVAGLGIHALMSRNEDFQEVSDTTRATHWMVKTGQYWTAIPKPFEMAVVINAAEAIWDAFAEKDPLAASRYVDGLFSVIAPPNLLEGLPGLKFYYEQKTNTDMFTGRPIVPDALQGMETWLQYTASTSQMGRLIGDTIGVAPVMVDQFLTTQFGTLGRSAMALSDLAGGDKPSQGWDEFFISRRFVKMASRGSSSSRQFWDLISERTGELEGKAKSYLALADAGDMVGAADFLATLGKDERAYVAVEMLPIGAQRLHPLVRARGAVQAVGFLRRSLASNDVRDLDGNKVDISSADRGAADDILADLAMVEARNALIAVNERGWSGRKQMATEGYIRELEAVSPALREVLAARYNKAKVWRREVVEKAWPEFRQRLIDEGTDAEFKDLEMEAKAAGVELDGGKAAKRERPKVPGAE